MQHTIEQFISNELLKIELSENILSAKRIFDNNDIHLLPVVSNNKLIGMLNHRDIVNLCFGNKYYRNDEEFDRVLLSGISISELMIPDPIFVYSNDSIEHVSQLIIKEGLHAIPVVDYSNGNLLGIVSLSSVLEYVIGKLKSNQIKRKYIEIRPWGHFEQYCQNTPCTVKILNVKANEELSLQYHRYRKEFWKVIQGEGSIVIGEKEVETRQGEEFIIPAKTKHQIKTKQSSLQILEISFGHFDEKDIVRLMDKYKRHRKISNQIVLS